jgi:hypothetical protein
MITLRRVELEEQVVDGRLVLKWVVRKWGRWHGLDLCGSACGPVVGCCMMMNLCFSSKVGNFQTVRLPGSEGGLCTVELVTYL